MPYCRRPYSLTSVSNLEDVVISQPTDADFQQAHPFAFEVCWLRLFHIDKTSFCDTSEDKPLFFYLLPSQFWSPFHYPPRCYRIHAASQCLLFHLLAVRRGATHLVSVPKFSAIPLPQWRHFPCLMVVLDIRTDFLSCLLLPKILSTCLLSLNNLIVSRMLCL